MSENNKVGDLVATIVVPPGTTLRLNPPQGSVNPFYLNETKLFAAIIFDFEVTPLESDRTKEL